MKNRKDSGTYTMLSEMGNVAAAHKYTPPGTRRGPNVQRKRKKRK